MTLTWPIMTGTRPSHRIPPPLTAPPPHSLQVNIIVFQFVMLIVVGGGRSAGDFDCMLYCPDLVRSR